MRAELPILFGPVLMAADMVESLCQQAQVGNNVTINLERDTREQTERSGGGGSGI